MIKQGSTTDSSQRESHYASPAQRDNSNDESIMKIVDTYLSENTKFTKKIKKGVLKRISDELKRLNKEYIENRNILDSYNKLIVDSTYYMIDRDNLSTSVLTGIHDSRIDFIIQDLVELSLCTSGKKSDKYKSLSGQIKDSNSKRQTEFRVINQEIRKCSNTLVSTLNIYSNQINCRINMILEQRKTLQKLYNMVLEL